MAIGNENLPEGWDNIKISKICDIKPSKRKAKERLSLNDLVSFVPMNDLPVDNKFIDAEQTKTLDQAYSGYVYFEENDVLLAKITPCFENGKLGIAKNLENGIGFGSSEYIVYRPKERILSDYLYYFLNRNSFRIEGKSMMGGAVGHQRIPKDFYEEFQIPLPPLATQRAIVARLDAAFARIDRARVNLERNVANARELFQAKLNEVFSRRGDGWEEKPLKEICTLVNGKAYKRAELLQRGKYPVLRVGNLFTGKQWYYSNLELKPNKYVDNGDLIYAWSASFGPRIWEGGKVIYHYHIWKVIPKPSLVDKQFLYHILDWDTEQIKSAHGTGTTMMHVGKGSMEARTLPVPPLQEQVSIVEEIDQLHQIATNLEKHYQHQIENLTHLKQSLLQKAFRGELIAEAEAETVADHA